MKVSTLARILALVMIAALCLPAMSTAAVIYSDGFEAWPVGAYPAPPWVNMFPGQSGTVTDLVAHGGSHSFQSMSLWNSSRCDYVAMASIPDLVEYQGSVRVDTPGFGGGLGFPYVDPNASNTFWTGNTVLFGEDGLIHFYSRSIGSVDLGPWSTGVWYDVKVQIDYTRLRADVWIDNVLKGHDLVTEPKVLMYYGGPVPLDKFGFFGWSMSGGVQYLDDVTLSSDWIVPARPTTWGSLKSLSR